MVPRYKDENRDLWRRCRVIKVIAIFILFCVATCLQMAFYESVMASSHRTLNGEEADFFFVPVLDSCIINRADDAPHLSMEVRFMKLNYIRRFNFHFPFFFWQKGFGRKLQNSSTLFIMKLI